MESTKRSQFQNSEERQMRESGRPEALTARSQSGDVDVPPEEWIAFLDSFSRQHEGWLASVSVTRGSETLSEVKDCQVKGISADHVDERDRIYISIGRNGEHLTHPVTNPMRVTFKRDLGGAHEGLDIASSDGTVTSVRFRIASRPETLDGVISDSQHTRGKRNRSQSRGHKAMTPEHSRKQENVSDSD